MKRLLSIGSLMFLVSLCGPLSTSAQTPAPDTETNRMAIIPFLEGTDVFWTLQSGHSGGLRFPNKLEADIFPHLVAAQNYTDVLNLAKQQQKGAAAFKEWSYSISGTPAVRIRMLRETSAPVRTPSYMPRGNFQLIKVRGLKDCVAGSPSRKKNCHDGPNTAGTASAGILHALTALPRVSVWEAHLIVGHHSNGQDGCITKLQHREPPTTGPCVPPAIVNKDNVNGIDGSFATNYWKVGVNYSRNWLPQTGELHATHEMRGRIEFEHHPRAWMDENIADLYGHARVNIGGAFAMRNVNFCARRLETSSAGVWNPGVVGGVDRFSWTVQLSCFPALNGGWGYFVRYYHGQDYYNIAFLNNIARVHVGFTFNQTGFFRFRPATP